MADELFLLSERIKMLRESNDLTQSELAKQLGLTRSSINAWEMGLSIPSTQYIVELSKLFNVSADFILGIENKAVIAVDGLSNKEVVVIKQIVDCLRKKE